MEKIKKISAALIALTMCCGMLASCGEKEKTKKEDSKAAETTAPAEEEPAESEADADAESEAEEDAAGGDNVPDPNFKPQYDYNGYDAFLMFGDMSWLWGNWQGQGVVHAADFDETDAAGYGYGIDADITGDGEYTVSITKDSIVANNGYTNPQVAVDEDTGEVIGAESTVVFCVDIVGLMDGSEVSGMNEDGTEWVNTPIEDADNKLDASLDNHYNVTGKGDYKPSDLKVTLTSIKCDGEELEFDESKIRYGNIEDNNNNYRIEIFNSYGKTAEDPGIDITKLVFSKSLEVTFTIEGLGEVKTFPEVPAFGDGAAAAEGDAAAETEAPAEDAAAAEGETEAAADEAAADAEAAE